MSHRFLRLALDRDLIREGGSDAVFLPFHVSAEAFPAAVAGLRKLHNFAGFTLTIPHKRVAMELCDRLGPMAAER